MFDEGAEVGGGDAAAMMDGAEGAAGVGDGTAEGHGEELLLHALEGIHGGVFEEGGEVGVGEDSGVEGWDEGFDDGGTADAIVEGGHGEEEGVWSSVFWGAEWMPKRGGEVVGDEDERKIGWVMNRFGG